jgi:FG-GAP repeat
MREGVKMKTRIGLLLIALLILHTPIVQASEDYNHIYSLEAPSTENNAWYGYQVEINEDYIVVSEPYRDTEEYSEAGKIYVYDHDGNLVSSIISPTSENTDLFGYRVDLFEDKILSGEMSNIDDLKYAGRAYLYDKNGSIFYSFQSEEPTVAGYFGVQSVSLDADIIVISEAGAKTNTTMAGRIHLYDSQGNYLKSLESPSPRVFLKFGQTVKVGEGLILVGEYGDTKSKPMGTGSVYAFDYSGNHLFTLQAPEPENQAAFGKSITLSDEFIVVGEPWATVDEIHRAGRVHIYTIEGEHVASLHSLNPKSSGVFGWGVAIEGDRIVVGEWNAHVNPLQYEGRAYIYDTEGNLLQNLTAPDPCPRAAFGLDVDIYGDLIVIGECWAEAGDLGQAGRAHVYKLGAPVETQETVEETTTETEETEIEKDDNGGIPSFPIMSIFAALIIYYLLREWMKGG